jgi:hypothetical protein
MVTCSHVWDAYETKHDADAETVLAVSLGDGRSNLAFKNPKDHCVALDRDLDLVVLDFEPAEIRVPHNKSWFKVSHWPLPRIGNGDHIVTLGFPGAWRETAGEECFFRCAAIPFLVTDVNGRTIAAFPDGRNNQVLNDMKNSLGGLSGSPAYRLDGRGELELIGFAKLGAANAEVPNRKYQSLPDSPLPAVFFTHASFLQPDGSLSR